ncbi:hypothetical protein HPMBJEAJ_00147 [Aeromonas phage avDM6]|nr:hypothetical protein HPMBJEAJ_00147 [Aeromonas phage avDM6]
MMKLKIFAVLAIIIAIGGSAWYMTNKIESQGIVIGELTQTLETTKSRLNALETSISDFKLQSGEYSKIEQESNRELSKRINTLEVNAGRGQVAIDKKPKLVEKLIQKDYVEFGVRMDCITMGECK